MNWFRRRLGYHVCDEFTRWTVRTQERLRAPTADEFFRGGVMHQLVRVHDRWQERECTVCGKVHRREIK